MVVSAPTHLKFRPTLNMECINISCGASQSFFHYDKLRIVVKVNISQRSVNDLNCTEDENFQIINLDGTWMMTEEVSMTYFSHKKKTRRGTQDKPK